MLRARLLISPAAIFLYGLGLQIWLWSRAWLYWDQILLLKLGMRLALDGQIAPFAKIMSGGGVIPGSLLQFLVGLPLALWFDYRSPALLVILFHLAAGLLLWRLMERAFGQRFAAVYLAIYWLSPWRLYHSGFIWEPNYLLLPAALHLWATWKQRQEAWRFASVVLGSVLVLTPQIHASGFLLVLLTALVSLRRISRVNWVGLGVGGVVSAAPLLPTISAYLQGSLPAITPEGHLGTGFARVFPLFKAAAYWLRLGTLEIGRRLQQVVFFPGNYEGDPQQLADLVLRGLRGLGLATMAVGLVASIWYFRRRGAARSGEAEFFRRYALSALLALILGAGLAPFVIQGWHALILLHAVCLPVAAWIHHTFERPRKVLFWIVATFLFLRLPIVGVLAMGHPMYRIPDDPQERARVAPQHLPSIELQRIPFGASKDKPLPRSQDPGSAGPGSAS